MDTLCTFNGRNNFFSIDTMENGRSLDTLKKDAMYKITGHNFLNQCLVGIMSIFVSSDHKCGLSCQWIQLSPMYIQF